MEKDSLFFGDGGEDEHMELPPGFRFHPTDEELITHYLTHKVLDSRFFAKAIGEVDLNKVEPWDLPWRAKMGESEWYFFCVRDRKYPTGMRTNRATDAGYWKATGKDKEIYRGKSLIGMKKTLVFYKGRAPKGEKSDWVMHEYRLEGKYSPYNLPETAKNEWVISRIFQKGSGGKKTHISGLVGMSSYEGELKPSNLPPLMDCSAHDHGQTRSTPTTDTSHVTCFSSDPSEDKKSLEEDMVDGFRASSKPCDFSPVSFLLPKVSVQDSLFSTQLFGPNTTESLQFSETALMQYLLQNNEMNVKRYFKSEFSPEAGMSTDISSVVSNHGMGQRSSNEEYQEDPISSAAGPVDLDCLWNY